MITVARHLLRVCTGNAASAPLLTPVEAGRGASVTPEPPQSRPFFVAPVSSDIRKSGLSGRFPALFGIARRPPDSFRIANKVSPEQRGQLPALASGQQLFLPTALRSGNQGCPAQSPFV